MTKLLSNQKNINTNGMKERKNLNSYGFKYWSKKYDGNLLHDKETK
jgi:hypothetical protein